MNYQPLTNDEISSLCRELSLLLHAGVNAADGLFLLAEEASASRKPFLTDLAHQTDSGTPLHEAIRNTGCLPAYAVGLLEMGDTTGRTEEALQALSLFYERRSRLDRQVRSALLYPSILLLLMVMVIVILLARVLPVFNDVYASLGTRLSGVAGGLLAAGQVLNRIMPFLCVLLVCGVALLLLFSSSSRFRGKMLSFWRSRRGDRGISGRMATAQLAQALAMGMRSGLPLEEALTLAAKLQADIPGAEKRFQDCQSHIEAGDSLSDSLQSSSLLPASACHLLTLGLRSGTADSVMEGIAERLSEESEAALEDRISCIEPTMVILTSILVGVILLSVMLPLMHIMSAIG